MLGIDCVARGRWPEPNVPTKPAQPVQRVTHEQYIQAIRDAVLARLGPDTSDRQAMLARVKVVYGAGLGTGARGLTVFGTWHDGDRLDLVEVCASGEESDVQLAGTTVHELAHVLAGATAGHGKAWKDACHVLGLVKAEAAGQAYQTEHFAKDLWARIEALALPTDGKPVFRSAPGLPVPAPRPCPMGIGTRGGKSRGKGSGSRLRLYECECKPDPSIGITNKVRVASDTFDARCLRCESLFKRK